MATPLRISIVIPAYNEERYIASCLDAIAAQILQPAQVIVVDNNSTDTTAQICRQYSFVTLLTCKKQGVVFARDMGFNAATGDIIARLDADSRVPTDWTQCVADFYAAKEHASHAYTGGIMPYNTRLPCFMSWLQEQMAFRLNRFLLGHYILFGSNMAMPTTMWRKVRATTCTRTDIHEDLDLSIHLYRLGYHITYQSSLRVGVKIRRVRSDRDQLWDNLMMWPRTLRIHGQKGWIFGWLGALGLYIAVPIPLAFEAIARLFGRSPLPE